VLTSAELVEIRAAQRTFEGAYVRTAIGQFSFALIVLKIFTAEFYSIGALFSFFGAGILFTSLFRRQQGAFGANTQTTGLMAAIREQTVLFRSRPGRPAAQEVQDERERRLRVDCAEHLGVCLSAGAHAETGDVIWDHVLVPANACQCRIVRLGRHPLQSAPKWDSI
jgi:hypothetical protein